MHCPQCGSTLAAGASYCSHCGSPVSAEGFPPPSGGPVSGQPVEGLGTPTYPGATGPPRPISEIPTYLAQAILTTICCCLPFGVVAIVYAANASSKKEVGDYAGALRSSHSARTWCWVAFIAGILSLGVWGFWVFIAAVAEA